MDNQIKKEVISILVDNQANVLTRVISLFGSTRFQYRLPDGIDDQ